MNIAIVFAGGSGVRMGSGIPKQFLTINGKPIIIYTLQLFQYHGRIDKIYLSVLDTYISYMQELIEEYRLKKVVKVIPGGATAQDSIYHALKAAESENPEDSIVLIHDGVRPFVSYEVISNNIESVKDIIAVHDAVRKSDGGYENMVDACTMIRSQGMKAHMVMGNRGNIKVTTPEDVYIFRSLLQYKEDEQAFGYGLTNRIETRMNRAMGKE